MQIKLYYTHFHYLQAYYENFCILFDLKLKTAKVQFIFRYVNKRSAWYT